MNIKLWKPKKINKKLKVPKATSVNMISSNTYKQPEYEIRHSKRILYIPSESKFGWNYYDLKEVFPEGIRMSTAGEEYAIIKNYGKDITKIEKWNLYPSPLINITETGLRVPKGWENGKKGKNGAYPRIVLHEDKEVGEINIYFGNKRPSEPYPNMGEVIVEMDDVFGIPVKTSCKLVDVLGDILYEWYDKRRFLFEPNPPIDEISGHRDVAVTRKIMFGGLYIEALWGRHLNQNKLSYRGVEGSLPDITKYSEKYSNEALISATELS